MKYYLIYYLDNKKDESIQVKAVYLSKEDAVTNLENVAVNYVNEFQGKIQAGICKQDKTPEQILADPALDKGMYLVKDKKTDSLFLYEKVNVVLEGILYNSYDKKITKIGKFDVTEAEIDTAPVAPPMPSFFGFKTPSQASSPTKTERLLSNVSSAASESHTSYMEELKKKIQANRQRAKEMKELQQIRRKSAPTLFDELVSKYNSTGGSFALKPIPVVQQENVFMRSIECAQENDILSSLLQSVTDANARMDDVFERFRQAADIDSDSEDDSDSDSDHRGRFVDSDTEDEPETGNCEVWFTPDSPTESDQRLCVNHSQYYIFSADSDEIPDFRLEGIKIKQD